MNPLQRMLAQIQTFWANLTSARRIMILILGAILIAAGGAFTYFSTSAEYRVLFSNLSVEDSGVIVAKLQAQSIPYKLEAGGTSITVPEDKLVSTRVALAQEGIPVKGGKGFEIFDDAPLGMTPFVQNVNYTRALQAELARSIMQLEPISSARVIIARAEPSPFVRDQKATTASVVLKLKTGANLNRSVAAGIVALVARSVEGLKPENVTVVDSNGRMLSDPRSAENEGLPTGQMEYRRELESHLAAKAEDMLSRHLGAGRAIVRVSADVNFQKVKERRETYSPDEKVVAAERVMTSKSTSSSGARGAAGTASNVSIAKGPSSGGNSGNSSEESIQTDYLVSKSVRELEDRMGGVQRLTIAAMIDLSGEGDGKPLSAADAQEIIKQAVGYRSGRDEIKVSDVKLLGVPSISDTPEDVARLQKLQAYVSLARNISLITGVVVTIGIIALLLLRGRRPLVPADTAANAASADATKASEEQQRRELEEFINLAQRDPDRVAGILVNLLGGTA